MELPHLLNQNARAGSEPAGRFLMVEEAGGGIRLGENRAGDKQHE